MTYPSPMDSIHTGDEQSRRLDAVYGIILMAFHDAKTLEPDDPDAQAHVVAVILESLLDLGVTVDECEIALGEIQQVVAEDPVALN